ncbi:unnamed protein product [Rhizopus stolonifer]
MTVLDIRGCLDNSPTFRKRIQAHEESIQNFEQSLKTLIKLTRSQVELSTAYSQQQKELAEAYLSFAHAQDDPIVAQALEKFGKSIVEVEKSRAMFNTHVTDTFISPLNIFLKETVLPVKDLKKKFENQVTIKVFYKTFVEYVSKLNDIEAKKKIDYMENVLAYMYTESAFHHQGYEILKDLEPYMRDLTGLLHDTRERYNEEVQEATLYQKTLVESTTDQYNPMQVALDAENLAVNVNRSGYLFERKNGRVYQSWSRKYYSISNGELISVSRNSKAKDEDGTQMCNLRVCSVKLTDSYDRRFCFEVISPNKILVLQAENEQEMNEWVQSIRVASQLALNSNDSPKYIQQSPHLRKSAIESCSSAQLTEQQDEETNRKTLKKIRFVPGNDTCADCKANNPEWACTNLGVIVCIECSGIHRSLGVHVSKVRSVVLDKWESESIEVMLQLGNTIGNSIYEENIPTHLQDFQINPDSESNDRGLWIIEKYAKKSFVKQTEMDKDSLDQKLWDAVSENDLPSALRCIAQGANVDCRSVEAGLQSALQKAVDNNNETTVEFLLQSQSNVNEKDGKGWTALHYAAANNNVRLVLTLLKRHAQPDITDDSNKTPLDLAVDCQSVQTVTALRLFAFDKQHNSSPSSSLDFGFSEAISSFKHTNMERPNITASHSAVDLSHTKPMVSKSDAVLIDDQNSELLHPENSL